MDTQSAAETAAAPARQKLFLSANGLALSSFPGRQSLSRTITVSRPVGSKPGTWTAVSDQSWLTVTPSGPVGGTLTVTADPAAVASDASSIALVTVATSDPGRPDPEVLRVGLWRGAADPGTVSVSQNVTSIVTNPVEPIAYVANGADPVRLYNVYTGALVATFPRAAPNVGALEISSDGKTLFESDATNFRIIAVDSLSGARLGVYPLGYPIADSFNMVYARPFGREAIFAAGGPIIAYPSGAVLAKGLPFDFLAVTPDGRNIFSVQVGVDPAYVVKQILSRVDGKLTLSKFTAYNIAGDTCQDLAVSSDGRRVYPACSGAADFYVFSGATLKQIQTLSATPYPNNAEIDSNGDFVGGLDGRDKANDVYVFGPRGRLVGTVRTTPQSEVAGQGPTLMKVSGDSTRVVSATDSIFDSSQTLMFRSLP